MASPFARKGLVGSGYNGLARSVAPGWSLFVSLHKQQLKDYRAELSTARDVKSIKGRKLHMVEHDHERLSELINVNNSLAPPHPQTMAYMIAPSHVMRWGAWGVVDPQMTFF